jgi:hypothetical protein
MVRSDWAVSNSDLERDIEPTRVVREVIREAGIIDRGLQRHPAMRIGKRERLRRRGRGMAGVPAAPRIHDFRVYVV